MEDEGKSSCESCGRSWPSFWWFVKIPLQKFKSMQKYRKLDFLTSGIYSDPPFGRPTPGWGPTELPINHLWWPLLVLEPKSRFGTLQVAWGAAMTRRKRPQ